MKTKQDKSFGVIPVIKKGSGWQVFLINQYGSTGDTFWTLPKGHPEVGESAEEVAKRELFEETGLEISQLCPDKKYSQVYTFRHGNTLIEKTVTFFLGLIEGKNFVLQEEEVKEAGWFNTEDAGERLTYSDTKDILRQAMEDLVKD